MAVPMKLAKTMRVRLVPFAASAAGAAMADEEGEADMVVSRCCCRWGGSIGGAGRSGGGITRRVTRCPLCVGPRAGSIRPRAGSPGHGGAPCKKAPGGAFLRPPWERRADENRARQNLWRIPMAAPSWLLASGVMKYVCEAAGR
ncbi:hypothetical protein MAFF211479_06920 [Ralstonia solanacearum]|nr:hypothetical protein MAFF211479_06920 [Ralstonia solanacearum]BCL98633.1 hypothetical protein MAFF211491_30850 [Ralstonia solanacearum]BCM14075.1 hypothetical protein MAFF241648_32650 [Ralstonia solanacearum]BCN03555.1 hypothetical protein RPSB_06920 [Ralstonia solanacearum]BCN08774.1 hypothetical protein RPSD_06590 [Ralstonia solanacearum]